MATEPDTYRVSYTANQINQAIGRGPIIGDDNYWYVWDILQMKYVNTGVYAAGGGVSAGVQSFNGRTGAVTPAAGDYTAEMIGALGTDIPVAKGAGQGAIIANNLDTNEANAEYAFAEGTNTLANGIYSHTEGNSTETMGQCAHAEGAGSQATAATAHAENYRTVASGVYSHSSGNQTVASNKSQFVFGEFNALDPQSASFTQRGDYVEIVGNGASTSSRSNARTLDWSGNEVLAGKLTVGAAPTADMDVATKKYVDDNSGSITVDTAMSTTSTNPVQNKVITAALNGKASTSEASTSAAGLMSSSDKTKLNGITAGATANAAYTSLPNMNGTASAGSSANYSRGDHVHPTDTSRQPKIVKKTISLSATWSGSGPYTQTVSISGITSYSKIDLQPSSSQITQLISDGVTCLTAYNNSGTVTVYAFGAKTTTAMSMQCTITEASE